MVTVGGGGGGVGVAGPSVGGGADRREKNERRVDVVTHVFSCCVVLCCVSLGSML